MHVKELGARAGINHEKLCRIMRLLATKHIFQEGDEYSNYLFNPFKDTNTKYALVYSCHRLLRQQPIEPSASLFKPLNKNGVFLVSI